MLVTDSDLNHSNVHYRGGLICSNPHPHLAYRYDPVDGTFETRKSMKVSAPKNSDGVPWALLKKTTDALEAESGGKVNIRSTTAATAQGVCAAIEVWAWVPEHSEGKIGLYLNHMLRRDVFVIDDHEWEMLAAETAAVVAERGMPE